MYFHPQTLLFLKYGDRSVAVFRDQCHTVERLLVVARGIFPPLQGVSASDVILSASIPGYPDPDLVELAPEIWTTVFPVLHAVTITHEPGIQSSSTTVASCSMVSLETLEKTLTRTPTPGTLTPTVTPLRPIFVTRRQSWLDRFSSSRPPATRPDSPVQPPMTMTGTSREALLRPQVCRKPVIYLYPPSSLADVTVELSLVPSWRLSAVHPPPQTTIPPGEPHTAQSVTWSVAAEPNGTLVDTTTGVEVSYLYWEAHTKSHLLTPDTSRATTPIADTGAFDPLRPYVNPGDSVLLPTSKVPSYLDEALKALTLHTEARTSFITYWLPDMLRHEHIALRFIAQESYEKAAALRIAPAPDVVTRVFMLFRGVAAADLGLWEQASARVTEADGATFWADVVGVDGVRAADRRLFRVLEWGGMEVR